ncbi:conserved hypothetical protein [Methylobacterium sp. 4-46]|uniref:hypothetical protein n=1 Tax=unclassified Methylobacterium TaxID=2615210 RepID=UPI000152DA15|nr:MULTISPECIES: hypothetical protein [Methylobacterium]ACA20528.1 conserved hypothetical protein [Methylobacterium sp. 4-46]WFT79694.1 hypothetical protein QA634_31625 [Methylobacterium nodulans]
MIRATLSATVLLALAASPAFCVATIDGECLIQVNGRTVKDGFCRMIVFPGGSFQTGAEQPGEAFAIVSIDGRTGRAEAFWNGVERASHAHDPLGNVVRQGGCWVNDRARVCAWRPGTRPR